MSDVLPEECRQELKARLLDLYAVHFSGIARGPEHLEQMARDSLDERRSAEFLEIVEVGIGKPLKGLRTLEVGCGLGLAVAVARRKFAAEAKGIEPGADEYDGTHSVSRQILNVADVPLDSIVSGVAESMPFDEGTFDVVMSTNVLEHVADPGQALREMIRVVKPGGHIVVIVPNYGSWWEGHYGVLWLPGMPLWLAKSYISFLGRDPDYLDTLNFVSVGKMRRWLAAEQRQVEILDWGKEIFRHRMNSLGFSDYGAVGRLKNWVGLLHRLKVVGLVTRIFCALNWQTPIGLVAPSSLSNFKVCARKKVHHK